MDTRYLIKRLGILAAILQRRIDWIVERYHRGNSLIKDPVLESLKQEIVELQAEDASYDKLRSLPLYAAERTYEIDKIICKI